MEIATDTPSVSMLNDCYQDGLEGRVRAIVVEKLGVDEDFVTADASFTEDLGADSLDHVELIMEFEKEFDITLPDELAERIYTVGGAVRYICLMTS